VRKIGLNYSYLQLDKSAGTFISKYALDYLKHKVVVSVDHSVVRNLTATWKLAYLDRSGTYDANKVYGAPSIITNFTPYFMLDGRLNWSHRKFDIYGDVNNILNASYADYGGLIQPGTNVNVGVRIKLN